MTRAPEMARTAADISKRQKWRGFQNKVTSSLFLSCIRQNPTVSNIFSTREENTIQVSMFLTRTMSYSRILRVKGIERTFS